MNSFDDERFDDDLNAYEEEQVFRDREFEDEQGVVHEVSGDDLHINWDVDEEHQGSTSEATHESRSRNTTCPNALQVGW